MSKKHAMVRLRLDERLRESERQATSMALPIAVHHRLDRFAEDAKDIDATRAEIVGMLIAAAELDDAELESAVLRYRKLQVGDVIPADEIGTNNVISIKKRGAGRPAKSGNG
jgi:hypothetical protein